MNLIIQVHHKKSIDCGNELIKYIRKKDNNAEFLFLLSGGGSSLVENLVDNFSIVELIELTSALLSRGYNINDINSVRKYFSKIKGGKLAELY